MANLLCSLLGILLFKPFAHLAEIIGIIFTEISWSYEMYTLVFIEIKLAAIPRNSLVLEWCQICNNYGLIFKTRYTRNIVLFTVIEIYKLLTRVIKLSVEYNRYTMWELSLARAAIKSGIILLVPPGLMACFRVDRRSYISVAASQTRT